MPHSVLENELNYRLSLPHLIIQMPKHTPKSETFPIPTWHHKAKIPQLSSLDGLESKHRCRKNAVQISLQAVQGTFMKLKWILCSELGPSPYIAHDISTHSHTDVCMNTSKSKIIWNTNDFLSEAFQISDNQCILVCILNCDQKRNYNKK